MVTPAVQRQAVAHLSEVYGVSQRRAIRVIGADRKSVRYSSVRPDDSALRARLRELAAQRHRFGYRRLLLLIRREGIVVNHKKLRRLYREERLQVRRRSGRKRALGTRAPMVIPQGPNQRWSMDFVSDQLSDGRRFRIMTLVDDFSRECLALVADMSLSGARVARELDRAILRRGKAPNMIVSDNVLCGEGNEGTGQEVSNREIAPAGDKIQYANQVASTEKRLVLCHSKHRVPMILALTVLNTRY